MGHWNDHSAACAMSAVDCRGQCTFGTVAVWCFCSRVKTDDVLRMNDEWDGLCRAEVDRRIGCVVNDGNV